MRRMIAIAAGIGLACAALCASAGAVTFDVPATLGDREVRLTWQPDADDPLYTGNLEIFFEGRTAVGSTEISQLLFDRFGSALWTITRDGALIAKLREQVDTASRRTWVTDTTLVGLTGPVEVLTAALHPAGQLIAVGLADGRVAVWRPGVGQGVTLFGAHTGACEGISFKPDAVAADSSFVTVGADGKLIEWLRPGELRRETQVSATGGLTAVGVVRKGREEYAAVGHADGQLTVWTLGAESVRLLRLDAHPGHAVTSVIFSADGGRIATADESGGVRIWKTSDGEPLGGYQVESPGGGIFIAYTPRASAYLAYATRAGEIGVLDGFIGLPFNARRNVGRAITAYALSPDGLVGYFGSEIGELEWWHQGQCIPSAATPECFGGYMVWRGTAADSTALIKMRTYQFGDTTWNWTTLDTLRTFIDPDSIIPRAGDPDRAVAGPHNGIPYYYSLTKYKLVFSDGKEYVVLADSPRAKLKGLYRVEPGGEPTSLIPRVGPATVKPLLDGVFVVPDPYREDQAASHFEQDGPGHVRFFHLPAVATVRIYTTAGELVRTLEHRPTAGGESGGSMVWDLKNENQRDVVSGVYFYAVGTPSGESKTGYLTIVR
jgi:hypothetical protein